MGEGEGAKDVSDQITDEDQLLGARQKDQPPPEQVRPCFTIRENEKIFRSAHNHEASWLMAATHRCPHQGLGQRLCSVSIHS